MKGRQLFASVLMLLGFFLFVTVASNNFRATKSMVMPMTIWGAGFVISGSILMCGARKD